MNQKLLVRDAYGNLVACADEVQVEQVRLAARYARILRAVQKRLPLVPDCSGN